MIKRDMHDTQDEEREKAPIFLSFISSISFLSCICFYAILSSIGAFAKVRILTFHYNQPDFIELQHRCLQRFMQNDYEMIVFNDASTPENEQAIERTCKKLGIPCVRFEPAWHLIDPLNDQLRIWAQDPTITGRRFLPGSPSDLSFANQASVRHCHVIQYALDHYGYDHNDPVIILDGDAFLIRPLNIRQRLENFDMIAMGRDTVEGKQHYLWVPFIAFHPAKLPNIHDLKFHVAPIDGIMHDTGAQSQHYLAANPSIKYKRTLAATSSSLKKYSDKELTLLGFSPDEKWLIRALPKHQGVEFNIGMAVLHFREVSFQMPGHDEKAKLLHEFIERITK
jgi:hypothetical protein